MKHKIAEQFLNYVKRCDDFTKPLPNSVHQFLLENELATYSDEIIHILLAQFFNKDELDDLYYFAYESDPKVFIEEKQFDNLLEYWSFIDSTKKNILSFK